MIKLNKEQCRQAIYGGLLLGGGGGGTLDKGLAALEEVFQQTDHVDFVRPEELDPEAIIVNVSCVGSPSAKDMHLTAEDWKITLENFRNACGNPNIAGFTSCENGAASTANGWIASAATGLPMVDAPSDGRAHPTGTMGSIGLNLLPDYVSVQAATGGTGSKRVEMVTKGGLDSSAHLVRQAAAADGGMVGVMRNPTSVQYLQENAAVGAFAQALEIGKNFLACDNDAEKFVAYLQKDYEAKVLLKGEISAHTLEAKGGFDIGSITVSNENSACELTFWNEFMTAEMDGKRMGTFPDLICMLDAETGLPISTAESQVGMAVYAISIPHSKMILGAGLWQRKLYEEVGRLFDKDMVTPNEDLLKY